MSEVSSQSSGDTVDPVMLWLGQLTADYVHNEGWVEVNQRRHDLAIGVRIFADRTFPDDPQSREAFIDGFTFAFLGEYRLGDLEYFEKLLQTSTPAETNGSAAIIHFDGTAEAA